MSEYKHIYEKKDNGIQNFISENSRKKIMSAGQIIKIKKGKIIYLERDIINDIYFVMDGFVSLNKNSRYGEEKILFVCAKGEMLNETVLAAEKSSLSAVTLTDSSLLKIPKNKFNQLMEENHDIVMGVFKSLSRKSRRFAHQLGNANGTYPLEKHLASKIWKLARDYGVDTPEGKQVQFEVTVTFLAGMLGAKRESVSRAVSKLKRGGYILHDKGILTIPSLEKIRELV